MLSVGDAQHNSAGKAAVSKLGELKSEQKHRPIKNSAADIKLILNLWTKEQRSKALKRKQSSRAFSCLLSDGKDLGFGAPDFMHTSDMIFVSTNYKLQTNTLHSMKSPSHK